MARNRRRNCGWATLIENSAPRDWMSARSFGIWRVSPGSEILRVAIDDTPKRILVHRLDTGMSLPPAKEISFSEYSIVVSNRGMWTMEGRDGEIKFYLLTSFKLSSPIGSSEASGSAWETMTSFWPKAREPTGVISHKPSSPWRERTI